MDVGALLAPFFAVTGPFARLPVAVQRRAVDVLYYLPSIPSTLGQALVACFQGGRHRHRPTPLVLGFACLTWPSTGSSPVPFPSLTHNLPPPPRAAATLAPEVAVYALHTLAAAARDQPDFLGADEDRLSFMASVLVGYSFADLPAVPVSGQTLTLQPLTGARAAAGPAFWTLRVRVIEVCRDGILRALRAGRGSRRSMPCLTPCVPGSRRCPRPCVAAPTNFSADGSV